MKKIVLPLILSIGMFTGCSTSQNIQKSKHEKISKKINPYNTLSEQEKITAITNYLVQKEFDSLTPPNLKKPTKPTIKPAPNLVKGKFEKTSDFEKRIQKTKEERETYIAKLEADYKKEVLEYNRKNKEQTEAYNKKVQNIKKNLDTITAKAMGEAYNLIYGTPNLKAIDYDADNEIFYGELTSSKGNFSKKVAIKIPPSIAKSFYDSQKKPKIIYEYKANQIYLKDIKVPFGDKVYLAMLTDSDYKSSDIKVAINTRGLNIKENEKLCS